MVNRNLTKLPIGWAFVKVRDIADLISGQHILAENYNDNNDGIPYLTGPADFSFKYPIISKWTTKPKAIAHKDDVLLTVKGAGVGKTNILNIDKAAISRQLMAVRGAVLNHHYLFYYFDFLFHIFQEMGAGSTVPGIDRESILNFQIFLPPLNEQHRIVAKIEELFSDLDAGVEALKKAKAQLKLYRQAVLKAAFGGRLTAAWREAHKEELEPASVILERIRGESKKAGQVSHKEFLIDVSTLHSLPEKWEWVSLGELIDSMQNGIYKPREFYSRDGVACLRMYNIENGEIVWKDIKRMILSKEEIAQYELKVGDILINRVNSRELVGKAAVIPVNLEKCVYESKNIRMRLKTNYTESKYVNYWLRLFGQGYFNMNAQQVVGMASINQQQISAMPVPFTNSFEQYQIVGEVDFHFSIMDSMEKGIDKGIVQAGRLRQAILKKAFTGKLVPKDPEDEPAAEWLKRIKKEKTGHPDRKKPGRSAIQRDLNYG